MLTVKHSDPGIIIHNVRVARLDEVILPGYCMCEHIYNLMQLHVEVILISRATCLSARFEYAN